MKTDVTFLGVIRRVVGAKIFVEISPEIPSASPIIGGRVYRLGQVGSFVRIPLGFLNLYGVVSMVGASEITHPEEVDIPVPQGQRWIEVQLVGESYGMEKFQRGISVFPTLDDEVHIVTEQDLAVIYGVSGPSMVEIGTHAASESLSAAIDLDKIVTRHAAILGSTGSGKSNTVAKFLKALTDGEYPSARVVVIDPHGEYGPALEGRAHVFSIGDAENPLRVPYWALSFDELAWLLVDRRTASESLQDITLRDRIFEDKKAVCEKLKAGKIAMDEVTPDSPIPFNIRKIWYDLYVKEHATLREKDKWDKITYKKDPSGAEIKGDIENVIPPQFEPPGPGGQEPFWGTPQKILASYLNKIMVRLRDKRFYFLLKPGDYDGIKKDLHDLLTNWVDHKHAITVLDLKGVPPEVTDLVVGVVTRILFEGMFWGRDLPGIGKQRPLLIVYEEAHTYLPRGGSAQFVSGYACNAVRRIFKEGRKYGVGAIVVSQRPSELDETILSQCGTFFALRLSNSDDQGRVRSTVPDALAGLIDMLPALRTGEALVLGEAVQIPCRIRLPLVEPRPKSDDPEPAKRWKETRVENPPYDIAVTGWRCQIMASPSEKGDIDNGKSPSSIK
ncbi:MAG: DUF87 domain-containing protein [Desulfobacterales bacterium]|nr:DUF87 domain-containing protein [Desulfobacterales bacterium]